MIEDLARALADRRLLLFVGAGVSAGLGLPTWSGLVDRMADDLGYDRAIFRSFGDPWTLAEYYKLKKGGVGQLREWMERSWHGIPDALAASPIHEVIVALDFPTIYTTNYDRWIERAHDLHGRPCATIVTVEDMAMARPDVTHVVKYHGDLSNDASLVLAETDYFARLSLDGPLDIRLQSDAFGRSILFVGYSLADPNLRMLLARLRRTWEATGVVARQPRMCLFQGRPNPVQEEVLASWGVTVAHEDDDDQGRALLGFMTKLRRAREGLA